MSGCYLVKGHRNGYQHCSVGTRGLISNFHFKRFVLVVVSFVVSTSAIDLLETLVSLKLPFQYI